MEVHDLVNSLLGVEPPIPSELQDRWPPERIWHSGWRRGNLPRIETRPFGP